MKTVLVERYCDVYPGMDTDHVYFHKISGVAPLDASQVENGWKRYVVRIEVPIPDMPNDGEIVGSVVGESK